MQLDAGVLKHKCATIAEAEMLAMADVPEVLIAYPLVGPNLHRFARLVRKYPRTEFAAVAATIPRRCGPCRRSSLPTG